MHRSRLGSALAATLAVATLGSGSLLASADAGVRATPAPKPPTPAARVLIVLFDQMVPQYADQFAMPNFRRLRDGGTNFDKAFLGYMASETVISHNVIPSGLLPKHMGYTDEAYRDADNLLGKDAGVMHITGDLSADDFGTVQRQNRPAYPKLANYLHAARPGTKFITVGEKIYAVDTAAANGETDDIAVHLSGRKAAYNATTNPGGCANLGGAWRGPEGKNVPAYISSRDPLDPSQCGRFYVNSDKSNDYGTKAQWPSWLYPEDGNRLFPGNDPDHLGGDTWAADAAIRMMQSENWGGMFVTLGGIDKAGHMWGAQNDVAPADCTATNALVHVKCAAENADVQLGKLLDAVQAYDAAHGGRTLVVLTADHGATYGASFFGKTGPGDSDSNWYYAPAGVPLYDGGALVTDGTYTHPSPAIAALDDGNLQFSYQSTAIETWLKDHSRTKKIQGADRVLAAPGVIASYWHDGDVFRLRGTNAMTSSERAWWKAHGQELVDSMAASNGPDVIGLLEDRTSYGVYGDHGGAQESVQRVPMVFWSSGMVSRRTPESFRTTDILPTVLKAMGIPLTAHVDGRAHKLGG